MVRLAEAVLRTETSRAVLLVLFLALGAANGCTTNHDALARQPKAGSSAGGSAGASGSGGSGFGNSGNQTSEGGRRNPDDEPKGDDVLTIVNGVVDAPGVQLCFARLDDDGQTQDFVGSPMPELAYAASTVITQIEGLSFAEDAIQPWLLSGELSRLKGLDCEAAVTLAQSEEAKVTPEELPGGQGGAVGEGGAGGTPEVAGGALEFPTLRARPLAALPPATVNIGRSILMVLTGCSGGVAYTDKLETAVCGSSYTPRTPTLEPIIVKLSRVAGGASVGLQAVQASRATGSLDIRVAGDRNALTLVFASSVSFGSIEPRPADVRFARSELGVESPDYGLQAVDESGGVAYQEAWSDILNASGLPGIVAGRGYTAIFLGPAPRLIKEGWWNKSAFSLVDNDPTRE